MRKGYGKDAAEKGYRQLSARPWAKQEVLDVIGYLQNKIEKRSGMQKFLLIRDALIFSLLWETKSRGNNASMWRLENFRLPTGERMLAFDLEKLLPITLHALVPAS